ncbi:MAG: DUF531 family protein [Thermoplasmatota archaeon]
MAKTKSPGRRGRGGGGGGHGKPPAREHAPSRARELVRLAKAKTRPAVELLAEADAIRDLSWAATAMAQVATVGNTSLKQTEEALRGALQRAAMVERLGRRAEVLGDLAKAVAGWHGRTRDVLLLEVAEGIAALPDGEWTLSAIEAAAGHVGPDGREVLFQRAGGNAGFESRGFKAVLRHAEPHEHGRLMVAIQDMADAPRAEALGQLHHRGCAEALAPAMEAMMALSEEARAEPLRRMVWRMDDVQDLARVAGLGGERPDVLIACGARLDKLGDAAGKGMLLQAAERADLPPATRKRLEAAAEKAGLDLAAPAVPVESAEPEQEAVATEGTWRPERRAGTHTLALWNTYDGGLGLPHLRAVARAAPLAAAFNLDLLLVAFPADLAAIAEAAATETGIGEGAGHLEALLEAGRVSAVDELTLDDLPGWPVATTPKPDPERLETLERAKEVHGRLCVLMGLGPRGLPRHVLEACPAHYEITGASVSLETATAMGILAERLRALGPANSTDSSR